MSLRIQTRTAPRENRVSRPADFPFFWLLLGVLLLGESVSSQAQEPVPREYQLKAAFLYNFTKFVEWPGQAQNAGQPIVIGVWGGNPFGTVLESVVKDRRMNGRMIVIRSVQTAAAARDTQVLFIGASDAARLGNLNDLLQGAQVLTVGEAEAFNSQGGVINFVLDGDKLRFEINMDAAERAGLKINAQLQKLALSIRRKQ